VSQVTLDIGGTGTTTSFTFFTSQAAGRDVVSPIPTRSTATAPVSGAFISGAFTALRPIRFTSYTFYFTSTSAGSVDLQISTANTGAGGYQSAALTATDPRTVTPNYSSFHDTALWFGFQKNDSGTVRGYRANTTPNTIFGDGGDFGLNGPMRGRLIYQTVPNAPTSFSSPSKTTTSVSLSWVKPTDLGGPSTLTGYRILYKTSASSTWTATGDFGDDTTNARTITGLVPDTTYNFLVAATNSVTDARNTAYTDPAEHTGTNSAQLNVTTNAIPTNPSLSITRSGLVFSYSGSSTVANASISSYEVSRRISTDGGVNMGDWSVIATLSGTTYSSSFTGSPATSYQLRVSALSNQDEFGDYTTSAVFHAPNVPLIPVSAIVLSQNFKKANIDWDPFRTDANAIAAYNGAVISGYQVEARNSSDGGATFTAYANITTTGSGTTVFLTSDLIFGRVYQFRVRATSDVGNSAYQTSSVITIKTRVGVFNGSNIVSADTKLWNGSAFVSAVTSVWNGTEWLRDDSNNTA
jgi:hypothetical protein